MKPDLEGMLPQGKCSWGACYHTETGSGGHVTSRKMQRGACYHSETESGGHVTLRKMQQRDSPTVSQRVVACGANLLWCCSAVDDSATNLNSAVMMCTNGDAICKLVPIFANFCSAAEDSAIIFRSSYFHSVLTLR